MNARFTPLVPFAILLSGCGQVIPAPAAPSRAVPTINRDAPTINSGDGLVLIDSTDQPASVTQVLGRTSGYATSGRYTAYGYSVSTKQLCAKTPCYAALPQGDHEIVLQSLTDAHRYSSDTISVGREPTVFRHTMGGVTYRGALGTSGGFMAIVGVPLGITGGILWAVNSDSTSATLPALTFTGIGLTALGALLMIIDQPKFQSGSTTQWTTETHGGQTSRAPGSFAF